jgi:hypothetical protein
MLAAGLSSAAAANTLRNSSDVVPFRQQMQERHSLEGSNRAAVIYDIEIDLASRLENCASRRLKRKFREGNLFRTQKKAAGQRPGGSSQTGRRKHGSEGSRREAR